MVSGKRGSRLIAEQGLVRASARCTCERLESSALRLKKYGVDLSGPVKISWTEVSRLMYLPYGRYFRADKVVQRK